MSARSRQHDRRRNARHHRRDARGRVCQQGGDMLAGYWTSNEDMLLEYARVGCVSAVEEFVAANPHVRHQTLDLALLFAEEQWRDCSEDRHAYIATAEALIAAGGNVDVLSPDLANRLPSSQAHMLDEALPMANRVHSLARL